MIAAMHKDKCVERSISTMRAALGYNNPLPPDWNSNTEKREVYQVINLINKSFPGREIRIWCTDENWKKSDAPNCEFAGQSITCGEWGNEYIFGFTYHGPDRGHMVVGWPTAFGDMEICLTVAVRLGRPTLL